MTKRFLTRVVAPVIAVVLILGGASMAFGKQVVLFSAVSGKLIDAAGNPQAGVRIERKWDWKGSPKSDETVTGEDGTFQFPEVNDRSIMASVLPHEPVIGQDMIAHGPNGPVNIWGHTKHSYDANTELDGRPLNLSCRIDKEPSDDGLYWGTCVEWKTGD